jgi:hypothetical protein
MKTPRRSFPRPHDRFLGLAVFFLAACTWVRAELVFNGGFEESGGPNGPKGWLNGQSEAGALYIQDGKVGETVKFGTSSIKFRAGQEPSKCIWIMAPNTLVNVEAGKKYVFSYWLKRVNFDTPGLRFVSECKGISPVRSKEAVVLGRASNITGSSDWEKIETEIEIPENDSVAKLQLVFRLLAGSREIPDQTEIYVDNVSLVLVD